MAYLRSIFSILLVMERLSITLPVCARRNDGNKSRRMDIFFMEKVFMNDSLCKYNKKRFPVYSFISYSKGSRSAIIWEAIKPDHVIPWGSKYPDLSMATLFLLNFSRLL